MKAVLLVALILLCGVVQDTHAGEDGAFWQVQSSVYTRHFNPDPEHNNRQNLIGLERNEASGLLYGAATFRNTYEQRSVYAYGGMRFDSADYPLYLKVSGGLLHGYRGKYRDKIPLNRFGVAPLVVPALGMHLGPITTEVALLGASVAILNLGLRF
ncbi:hypothetical protein M2401_001551 [Pseudomonas sp. JUb42]|jgi:hypothetical protein|uniref:sn-glycerol-3-phosphate transporter n=1 Tax=Pseudomonas sp. JUb42 TaxID=2940611 RepID=UPI002167F71D|nr:sn-glycerol-3-phosphate transporter [Pseudomonas sp. JUb42]MCS3467826.1 hypothetical protein [Pseudomonas sp. JUb42]